jgi:hypothetical protein
VKAVLNKKKKAKGFTIPDLNTYYRAIVTKTTWYLYNNKYTDQQNRTETTEINPCIYSQLFKFLIKTPKTFIGKGTASSINNTGETGYVLAENEN